MSRVSFTTLRTVSFVHSAIYAALLACWLLPGLDGPTAVFGWAHGLLWIAMSLLVIDAARRATIPFWLAVVVAARPDRSQRRRQGDAPAAELGAA